MMRWKQAVCFKNKLYRSPVTVMGARPWQRPGMTLVEVMMAVVILMVSVIGISFAHVAARREIIKQRRYQEAIQLAAQKIEECRAIGYNNLNVGREEEETGTEELSDQQIYLSGLTCKRTTSVALTAEPSLQIPAPCKKVTVTVAWTGASAGEHEVELMTLIGP